MYSPLATQTCHLSVGELIFPVFIMNPEVFVADAEHAASLS